MGIELRGEWSGNSVGHGEKQNALLTRVSGYIMGNACKHVPIHSKRQTESQWNLRGQGECGKSGC